MQIQNGLFDHMVLQRNGENVCDAVFSGESVARGVLTATVSRDGVVVDGFDGLVVGKAADGKLCGCLRGLPVGGPYAITVRVAGEEVTVHDVLVGDVWICAGQSNMQGYGAHADAATPHPMVRAFYMNDCWDVAADPIHDLAQSIDPVHADLCCGLLPLPERERGTGPAVAFAQEMQQRTGMPQGLIACAHGGTSMDQWSPTRKKQGGRSLYGAMMRRFKKNGGKVAGVIWYQGCNETNEIDAPLYIARMRALVRAMRRDFGDARLPIVTVQIARLVASPYRSAWNDIQEQQRRLPEVIDRFGMVPAIDLPLDDNIHISGKGQQRLGTRLARAMSALQTGAGEPAIALKQVRYAKSRLHLGTEITLEFANVQGSLRSDGAPSGFELINAQGEAGFVYRIDLEGNRAMLHTCFPPDEIGEFTLRYGYGLAPVCNITDDADRAMPVFGPVKLGIPRAATPFLRSMLVSALQPSAGRLESLGYPTDLTALQFAPWTTDQDFLSIRPQWENRGDVLAYFTCAVHLSEPMRLSTLLGYDGPVKLWIDGEERFYDPNGRNPSVRDAARVTLDMTPGTHEILVALGSNAGRAWGIFLRFEREDISKRLVKKGPGHYTLPTIVEAVLA